jgi:hypothetical protein
MKKSLLVATALAVSSIAGSASALDVSLVRSLQVDGIGLSLGVITFLPLGIDGPFCDYLANWYSPFNPNDVGLCVVQELRTNFAPSCIINERVDITTVLTSSPVACTGFTLKGEPLPATLILSESICGLSGIVTFGGVGCTIMMAYPVNSCP